jgi:hypothetical protein
MASSIAGPSDQQRRVIIDGVTFEFDRDGQRLKRIGGGYLCQLDARLALTHHSDATDPNTPINTSSTATGDGARRTPLSLSMSGHQYIRTKSGNLIAAEVIRRRRSGDNLGGSPSKRGGRAYARQVVDGVHVVRSYVKALSSKSRPCRNGRGIVKSQEPCRYFTKTGAPLPKFQPFIPTYDVPRLKRRPLQSRVHMSLRPRSETPRHLSQVHARQMPLRQEHMSGLA